MSHNLYSKSYCLLKRPWWLWSYGSWIYNHLCHQWLSPPMLRVRISIRARCTTLCDKVCQWLATCRWFSLGPPVSSTNKTDRHDITEILLKVALNTIKQQTSKSRYFSKSGHYIFHWWAKKTRIGKEQQQYLLVFLIISASLSSSSSEDSTEVGNEILFLKYCQLNYIIIVTKTKQREYLT